MKDYKNSDYTHKQYTCSSWYAKNVKSQMSNRPEGMTADGKMKAKSRNTQAGPGLKV